MVHPIDNPFRPTAGMNPPELIGRAQAIEDFKDSLEIGVGAPYRLMRISGVRGSGKTALLNAMARIARDDYGFAVVNVTSEKGVAERIAAKVAQLVPRLSASIEPEALGFKLGSMRLEKAPQTLDALMLEATKRCGLLVTIDEIQDIDLDELRSIANNVQLVIREEGNIAFAFAGLPSAIDDAVNHPGTTFLQRAASIELTRLDDGEVQASFEEIVAASGLALPSEAAHAMARASKGHPFMVQLVGFYTWQAAARRKSDGIAMEDVDKGAEAARRSFVSTVIKPTLSRVSPAQSRYLAAMARCGEKNVRSGDVARELGRDVTQVAMHRARLIEAGILEAPEHGKASFAMPCLREYLLEDDTGL